MILTLKKIGLMFDGCVPQTTPRQIQREDTWKGSKFAWRGKLNFPLPPFLEKVFSDSARASALEARRANAIAAAENRAANAFMTVTANRGKELSLSQMRHVRSEVEHSVDTAMQHVTGLSKVPKSIIQQMKGQVAATKIHLAKRQYKDAIHTSRGVFELGHAAARESTKGE